MPKVSVIMPVYNTKEEYLREAIESILNQTYKDFELIIINDGSTNNSEQVILFYKDERIKYFKQENQGIAKTRNKAIELSKGEYIAIMDHDDISSPTRLEKEVNFLDNNPEYGVVGSWLNVFPGNNIAKTIVEPKIIDILNANTQGNSSCMIRKKILCENHLQYKSDFVPSEDYELWTQLIKYTKFHNIQEVLVNYRWHDTNTTIIIDSDKKAQRIKLIKENLLDYLVSNKKLRYEITKVISPELVEKITFLQKIFSVKNEIGHKVIRILGFKIKFKRNKK